MTDIHDLFYEAMSEESLAKRKQILKRIIKKDHLFTDAYLELMRIEDNDVYDRLRILDQCEALAAEALMEDDYDYFNPENIGSFYSMFETRPLMRVKYERFLNLMDVGYLAEAMMQGSEILSLNESDNMGVRYPFFALLCALDEYDVCLGFMKHWGRDIAFDLPLSMKYFSDGDLKNAKKYLKRIIEEVPDALDGIFSGIEMDEHIDTYEYHSAEHLASIVQTIKSLIYPEYLLWVLEDQGIALPKEALPKKYSN